MLKQAGNRLVVSPWFAAGAGFVIATGAIIYMPHARLDPAINITHCGGASCEQTQLTPQGGAKPKPAGAGVPLPIMPSLPAGMTFSYQVLGVSTGYGFSMLITIHSPRSFGPWQLSFIIPGARDLYVVYGARWKSSGTDGGTASSYLAGTESAGFAMISAHEDGGEGGSTRNGYTVQFQIRGLGTPSRPGQCTYNMASCTFRLAHNLPQAGSQGPG